MGIFVDTYFNSTSTDIVWSFPSYVDPLFLTLIVLLSLPGILLNPIVIKSRIARISNSIPALLTTCLCGVYLVFGLFISTNWTYSIIKDTPNQNLDFHNATTFDQVYTFVYRSGNLYVVALLYLMAFSRYRAIADPFYAIQYKEIMRKAIGFGVAALFLCLVAASLTSMTAYSDRVFKFSPHIETVPYFAIEVLTIALLISSLEHTWRTIKMLQKADDTPAETREQRRNGVKMMLVLIGGQTIQAILGGGLYLPFLYKSPYYAVTDACLLQCFLASYTAVVLIAMEKGTQSEVRKILPVVKRSGNTGGGGEGTAVAMPEVE